MKKTYFNWSSGKDSALALYYLLQEPNYNVNRLITTISKDIKRVTMHGLRITLLEAQIKAIGIPFSYIKLPANPTMETYSTIMQQHVALLKEDGYTHSAFGDIFLEDLRAYRDKQLQTIGLETVYPLWKKDTKTLLKTFLELGFKTIVIAASATYFSKDFVGTIIDDNFIDNLPEGVDPCGENGEFHTFCFDGPLFKHPVTFTIGETIYREYDTPNNNTKTGVWFCDLIEKKGGDF